MIAILLKPNKGPGPKQSTSTVIEELCWYSYTSNISTLYSILEQWKDSQRMEKSQYHAYFQEGSKTKANNYRQISLSQRNYVLPTF